MQITLKQTEIEEAIKDYLRRMGVSRDVSKMDFNGSRSPAGFTAEIDFEDATDTAPTTSVRAVVETKAPANKTTPKAPIEKPKKADLKAVEDVVEEADDLPDGDAKAPVEPTAEKEPKTELPDDEGKAEEVQEVGTGASLFS